MYLVVIRLIAARRPEEAPAGERSTWAERVRALSGVWPFVLLFGLIIGGLYARLFTPTEAAGMGAGLAMLVAMLQRRLTLRLLKQIIIDTAYTSISLYAVLFGALMLSRLLTLSGLSTGVLELVTSFGLEGIMLIVLILMVFLVLGCVMDSMAIILIFAPLFAPIVVAQGFDLVWFGILIIVATEIALITPPIGMNVYVLKAVLPSIPMLRIFKGLVPFVAADLVRLALLVAFPALALWLGTTIR
jgi:tripartite ATP-independent transporter DctM subunit